MCVMTKKDREIRIGRRWNDLSGGRSLRVNSRLSWKLIPPSRITGFWQYSLSGDGPRRSADIYSKSRRSNHYPFNRSLDWREPTTRQGFKKNGKIPFQLNIFFVCIPRRDRDVGVPNNNNIYIFILYNIVRLLYMYIIFGRRS